MYIDEWATAVAGIAAFIAPGVFTYTAFDGAAWGSWIVGAVIVIAALASVLPSMAARRHQHHTA